MPNVCGAELVTKVKDIQQHDKVTKQTKGSFEFTRI